MVLGERVCSDEKGPDGIEESGGIDSRLRKAMCMNLTGRQR